MYCGIFHDELRMFLATKYVLPQVALARCFALAAVLFGSVCCAQTQSGIAEIKMALQQHDFDRALHLAETQLKSAPADVRILTLRGMAYAGKHDAAQALRSFQQALEVSPDYLPSLEGAAQAAYLEGRGGAKPYLLRILTLRPGDQTTHAMLGVISYQAGKCQDAIEHFRQAQDILATHSDILIEYGVCLATVGPADAIPVLQRAIALEPANHVARYDLALAQWNALNAEDALKTLDPLVDDPSSPEDVLTLAAEIHESKNETQPALDLLRRAILAYPKERAAYLQFANLSFDHASAEVGIDILNAGINQLPGDAELYLARGILRSKTPHPELAMDDFEKANQLDPNLSSVGAAEGIAKSQEHKPDEALATFRSSAKQHPDDALTQYLLAEALSEESVSPGSSEYAEELAASRRAVLLDPNRPEFHDLLASIYFQSGEISLAVQENEAALHINPKDEQALFHLILALRKSEKKAEVNELVQRLIKVRQEKESMQMQTRRHRLEESTNAATGNIPN
jgi:tetratricopeptide (TPR) repeat protein